MAIVTSHENPPFSAYSPSVHRRTSRRSIAAGGVVYYANYLKFMERARTEWLRAAGFELPELARDHNVIFVVRSVAIEYLRPARLNDALRVTVHLEKIGSCTLDVLQSVERGDTRLAEARAQVVCVDHRASFKPVRIPPFIRQQLESTSTA